jgi:hypothetical protein
MYKLRLFDFLSFMMASAVAQAGLDESIALMLPSDTHFLLV